MHSSILKSFILLCNWKIDSTFKHEEMISSYLTAEWESRLKTKQPEQKVSELKSKSRT